VAGRIAGNAEEADEGLAIVLHELAHVIVGRCGGGDHRPDPTVKRSHNSLRCEQKAWEVAMTLWPFSRTMFQTLQFGLGSYRRPRLVLPALLLQLIGNAALWRFLSIVRIA
jgi:hypothetical protein